MTRRRAARRCQTTYTKPGGDRPGPYALVQDKDAQAMQDLLRWVNCNDRREPDTEIEKVTLQARQLAATIYPSAVLRPTRPHPSTPLAALPLRVLHGIQSPTLLRSKHAGDNNGGCPGLPAPREPRHLCGLGPALQHQEGKAKSGPGCVLGSGVTGWT